ncbi:hypothetical protein DI005_05655 [Prauserella sp. PE36]|uniref:hypothetical protein n=1 Tax=Prauserella sp. PE36 TaxID=1504709 RepID=UPI000DE4F284|nr:hypothetical protein [Prauserella sp. PE36]RBM22627.1 hypothetical protein DI005_05655 [Prauserella sp. PE36]
MPATRRVAASSFAVLCSLGLVVAVTGTFLPWFHSGTVERSSYHAVGLVGHFDLLDSALVTALLTGWIAVPLLSAVAAGLFALRLPRTGAALALVVALVVGTVSLLAVVQGGSPGRFVGVTTTGPITTTTGMAIALCGALGVLVAVRGARRGIPPHRHSALEGRAGVRP